MVIAKLANDLPAVPDYQNFLANTLAGLGEMALGQMDYVHTRQFLEQARPHLQVALKANSRHPFLSEAKSEKG